ncbi:hypothetical protein Patl1_12289 [Pistacia atlantica]|uniref:Uncharacterized protein n=1 Tax=Pistacia atlantica TaxID=434234 RepID=A0ACC1A1F8_9ROSI|nr:hypothetical protein Patl1_12289 [Pistacia atlantica]
MFDLRNVVIPVPLPALREAPSVRQNEVEWKYDYKNSVWNGRSQYFSFITLTAVDHGICCALSIVVYKLKLKNFLPKKEAQN